MASEKKSRTALNSNSRFEAGSAAGDAPVDFRMVTFTLAEKDYGIDIMQVREISRGVRYTMVPNTADYVVGVHNLRGDIVPIVDLRRFLHLPAVEETPGVIGNLIVLELADVTVGVAVDQIDSVVGVPSRSIQPAHPLFDGINVRFVGGVVEHHDRLYILIDSERAFTSPPPAPETAVGHGVAPQVQEVSPSVIDVVAAAPPRAETELSFVSDGLKTFAGFHVTDFNREWIEQRLMGWREERSRADRGIQIENGADAEGFLSGFLSADSGALWSDGRVAGLAATLAESIRGERENRAIHGVNVGCGRGHEAYSTAAALAVARPHGRFRLWAQDTDLIAITAAPTLVLADRAIPSTYREHSLLESSAAGSRFSARIRDSVVFEFHDIRSRDEYPPLDLVVIRDTISLLAPGEQGAVLEFLGDSVRSGGIVVVGDHEALDPSSGWQPVPEISLHAYRKT
jgi:purine-binding chemotaxis protein CheW